MRLAHVCVEHREAIHENLCATSIRCVCRRKPSIPSKAAKGLQVTAVSGTVWLTQAKDPRDIILTRGQSFILDRKGRAVVYALKDAAIVIGPAGHITAAAFAAPAEWDNAA